MTSTNGRDKVDTIFCKCTCDNKSDSCEDCEHEQGKELEMGHSIDSGFIDRYECSNCKKTIEEVFYVEKVGTKIVDSENNTYSEDF